MFLEAILLVGPVALDVSSVRSLVKKLDVADGVQLINAILSQILGNDFIDLSIGLILYAALQFFAVLAVECGSVKNFHDVSLFGLM